MGRAICGGTLMNLSLRMSPTGFVLSFRSLLSCSTTRWSQLCSQRLRSSSLICSAHWVPCNQKVHFLYLVQQLFTQKNLECQLRGHFLQAWWQFPSAASKALNNFSEVVLQSWSWGQTKVVKWWEWGTATPQQNSKLQRIKGKTHKRLTARLPWNY